MIFIKFLLTGFNKSKISIKRGNNMVILISSLNKTTCILKNGFTMDLMDLQYKFELYTKRVKLYKF